MQEILPDFILADLYPSSLVIQEDITLMKTPEEKSSDGAGVSRNDQTAVSSIVSTNTPPVVSTAMELTTPTTQRKLKNEKFYLGDNGKKISILVNEANAVYLSETSLDFLTKILGACKLNMGDVAVINIEQQPMLFSDIKKSLTPTVCLLFNVVAEKIQLPFTIPHYQVQQYANCTFLMAPELSTYYTESDSAKIEKTKLWVSLKRIFNI